MTDNLLAAFIQNNNPRPELTPDNIGPGLTYEFAPGRRSLLYSPTDHMLVVQAPFPEKDALKALGGLWHSEVPKGWSFYMNETNLAMLLDKMTFSFFDESIKDIVLGDRKHDELMTYYANAHAEEKPIMLRVPGLKVTKERFIRNYQKLAVLFGAQAKIGFLCGDEMGLGKSVMTIAAALWRKANMGIKRCLIIAPASVKFNWDAEIRLWCSETFTIIHGTRKQRDEQWAQDTFFKVTNPETIVQDMERVPQVKKPWDMIAFDEVHFIKRWNSVRSQTIKKLPLSPLGLRVGMSGTPVDGRLEDLHSIFEFLVPGLLGPRRTFMWRYAIRDEYNAVLEYKNVEDFYKTIRPFFIRRLKKDVAKDLPDKLFKAKYITLPKEELKLYEELVNQEHHITCEAEAMTVVLRARQFCDSPGLLDMEPRVGAKLTYAMELLEEIISCGHKVLVFSMFEKMVKILRQCCDEKGWRYFTITGETPVKERVEIARRFNEETDVDLCVMDEAGATGLNFQKATYVIHYDDNWSPAVMKQRTDRAHRLTTTQPVTVVNLVCADTVEERRVRAILNKKDALSASALGDDFQDVAALGPPFTAKQLMKLL